MKFEWETIYASKGNHHVTTRAKVFGGWLVKHRSIPPNSDLIASMVFVPDPNHEWEIE